MNFTKLWIDSYLIAPEKYYHADTINKAKNFVIYNEENNISINEINISSSEIEYSRQADGGNISDFLSWIKETDRKYNIVFH